MKSGASEVDALWMLSPMMQLTIYIIKLHADPHPEKNKNYQISLRGPGASENPVPLCMGPRTGNNFKDWQQIMLLYAKVLRSDRR